MFLRRLSLAICAVFWMGGAGVAHASFLFCNQTGTTIEAAFAYRDEGYWTSEGWWLIKPSQCARVYNKTLTQRFYFYHARALGVSSEDEDEPMIWSGKHIFCVARKAFRVAGDSRCELRGYRAQGFKDIDIGNNRKDYTLTFRDRR